ncbi:MAG: universal stress protein [Elainellaceae cyanobacterium]
MSFHRILAGLDCSELSPRVFETALEIAQQNQAELFLFHCLTADIVIGTPSFAGDIGLSPHLVNQAYQSEYIQLEQQTHRAQEFLQKYYEIAVRSGVKTQSDYLITEAGAGICRTAQAWNADLVVLGRRGRKGFAEALLGSVSNYALHHAHCAVLIVQGPSIQVADARSREIAALI